MPLSLTIEPVPDPDASSVPAVAVMARAFVANAMRPAVPAAGRFATV